MRVLFVSSLVVIASLCACGHAPKARVESAPPAAWKWQVPAPVVPPMAWVAAGPFRTADRTPETVNAIVIHTTEGGYKPELTHEENQNRNFSGVINYFKGNDRNVSAHFVMGPNGEICIMVNETDIAHTQTYYNERAFGIECAGWSSRKETWTPELLNSLVDLCAYLCVKWQIPAYHVEGTAYEGPYSTINENGDYRFNGTGLVGHFQVQPWNKTDPGSHFPWDDFSERVRAKIRQYGAEPLALPPPPPGLPAGTTVTAAVPDEIPAGETFVYTFIVEGPGVGRITNADIVFPNTANTRGMELLEGPARATESSDNRLVYTATYKATAPRGGLTIISPKVKINDTWHDAGTKRIRVKRTEEAPQSPINAVTQ